MPVQDFGNAFSTLSHRITVQKKQSVSAGDPKRRADLFCVCVLISAGVPFAEPLMGILSVQSSRKLSGWVWNICALRSLLFWNRYLVFVIWLLSGSEEAGNVCDSHGAVLGTRVALAYLLSGIDAIGVKESGFLFPLAGYWPMWLVCCIIGKIRKRCFTYRQVRERRMTEQEKYMKEAIRQAKKAAALEEVPIGCVIVCGGKIIARGYNRRNTDKNTLSHAELNAIRKASKKLGDWRLEGCTMYVTLEPCQMCAGALVQSRIDEVVIGAMNPKAGCAGSVLNLLEVEGSIIR